jgi:hypothetical protein
MRKKTPAKPLVRMFANPPLGAARTGPCRPGFRLVGLITPVHGFGPADQGLIGARGSVRRDLIGRGSGVPTEVRY